MDIQVPRQYPHASAHYGAAAIALAAVLLLMALPAFQMAFWLETSGYRGWSASDKRMAAIGGYIGTAVIEVLCLVGITIGLRGIAAASKTGEPTALSTVGIALCVFCASLWIMVGVAWHSQAFRFIKDI